MGKKKEKFQIIKQHQTPHVVRRLTDITDIKDMKGLLTSSVYKKVQYKKPQKTTTAFISLKTRE